MSYHAIENLVEDAVHLIEQSNLPIKEQRNIVYNLYQFQNRFDTHYTVLCCFPFLERIGFLKKLPIHQHPDFKKNPTYFNDLKESGWIYTDVDLADDSGVVYYQEGFIYPEYGARLWRRLVQDGQWKETIEEPQLIPISTFIANMIALAEKHGDTLLMHNFYLAFLNAYLEFDIGTSDGIPERFEDWIDNSGLLKLRELFVQHALLKIKKKETDFEIPRLSSELSYDIEPDKQAKIEFLMDHKKTVEKINGIYLKAQKALEELPQKIKVVEDFARQEMKNKGWIFASAYEEKRLETYKWLWYRDVLSASSTHRIFTEIILEIKLSSVLGKQYVQHGLLLEWQEKPITEDVSNAHFEINPFEFIYDENLENKLNFLGLWVLPFKSKQDILLKSFASFLHYLVALDTTYLEKIDAAFPELFFSKPYLSYINIFESDEPISEFLLIANLYSISLLFIYKLVQEGKIEEALEINDIQEARLTDRFREGILWYNESYAPYIKAVKEGQKPALPQLFKRN